MKVVINNIRLSLEDDLESIKKAAAKKLRLRVKDFESFKITKESIDARRKPKIDLVYSCLVEVSGNPKLPQDPDIKFLDDRKEEMISPGNIKLNYRPIIVGFGPAGMFAGLVLAQNGYKPIIIERGGAVDERIRIVQDYWKTGRLNVETNVQFGEGGAGTFSDGKLTTRINDRRCEKVIHEFYLSGAHEEILYKAKPHIGSDVLKCVVLNIRKRIEALGGEIKFNSKLTDISIKDGNLTGVRVNEEDMGSEVVVLAIGHSARDTFQMLFSKGIGFVGKPFSIGVRIEHPQEIINEAQYGIASRHPRLGAADYQLFYKTPSRTVYSFCMCPGGVVVASASEPEMIVTNGMSDFLRDKENANSALVVSVTPEDFGSSHPLAGIDFQRKWERMAYELAGRDQSAPVQRLEDFLKGVNSGKLGSVNPSYTGSVKVTDINLCLPEFITTPMKESIGYFDRKLKGFGLKDALLTGVETRTSSPVRIPRGDSLEAIGIHGLYPAGEGAGYAGGIVSAAVDGIRIAEEIIKKYAPLG
ncbi:MAG: NAD(P)/FAD-dependent oxidoreductase [Clostridia bacterium]|nr:NAD(P)/FAD-dependent oxidoreductase [Clostridia bacterium]